MKFSQQTVSRLKRLKSIMNSVEKNHPKEFDICEWNEHKTNKTGCGTTACALGWAASDPKFNKEGLQLKLENDFNKIKLYIPIYLTKKMPISMRKRIVKDSPHYYAIDTLFEPDTFENREPRDSDIVSGKSNSYVSTFDAGELFFGITAEMSDWLFAPMAYVIEDNESKAELLPDLYVKNSKQVTPGLVAKRINHLLKQYS